MRYGNSVRWDSTATDLNPNPSGSVRLITSRRLLLYSTNSSPLTACMCQWIRSALIKIMACRLVGAKPLSQPMLDDQSLETSLSEFVIKIQIFHLRKCIWKYRLRNGSHFVHGIWVKYLEFKRSLVVGRIVTGRDRLQIYRGFQT